jgi:hypothetical protein
MGNWNVAAEGGVEVVGDVAIGTAAADVEVFVVVVGD